MLSGSVRTADDQPAELVTIALREINTGRLRHGTITDVAGRFSLKASPGRYTLTASIVGYAPSETPLLIEVGQAIQLPPITLTQTARQLQEVIVTTRRAGAYTEKTTELGTRMPARLRDIPQSVQIINREILQDRQVLTVAEATKSMVGVNAFSSSQYSDYVLRGFRSTPGNFAYNGIRGDFFQFDQAALTYNIERIEAVKGPASVLFSAGNPGGVINHVTKRAQAAPRYEVAATVGSFNQYRFMGDATGTLTKNQKLLYRFIVGYENTGQLDPNQKIRNVFLAPQLQYTFSDRTTLNYELNYGYDRRTMGYQRGVPALSLGEGRWQLDRYPRDFSMVDPRGFSKTSSVSNQLMFSHRFTERIKLTSLLRTYQATQDQFDVSPGDFSIGATNDSITLGHGYFRQKPLYQFQSTTYLNAELETGVIKHALIAGIDVNSSGRTYEYAGLSERRVSLLNLDFSWATYDRSRAALATAIYQSGVTENTQFYGLYVQDQLSLGERWKLLLGGRFEAHRFRNRSFDLVADTTTARDTLRASRFIPRVGVVFQPGKNTSLYASYTEGFQPQYGSNRGGGGPYPPEGSRQIEVGMKNEWLAGRLITSVAAYYIQKTDVLTTDPNDPDGLRLIQVDEVKSKGIELSVQGNVTDNLSLLANYAYNEARTPGDAGFDFYAPGWFPNAPNHNGNLWATYKLTQGVLKGLKIGAGFNHLSKRSTFVPNFEVPGYTTVDASVSYERNGFRINGGLFNMTDTRYYHGVYGPANLWPGNPRSFRLTLSQVF
ncbi:TonB-dependent siderophore receptor [Spirosoma sordidisoli]|nr:TonB-dependent siderophore receptor [Spirosoma sordidisoli]